MGLRRLLRQENITTAKTPKDEQCPENESCFNTFYASAERGIVKLTAIL